MTATASAIGTAHANLQVCLLSRRHRLRCVSFRCPLPSAFIR
jgi:hypothetical protein